MLRLRLHAGAVGGQRKADGLPRLHAAVGQNGHIVCKKAAAMEFDRPGQLRGYGTPAQKAAQQHAIGFGWDIEIAAASVVAPPQKFHAIFKFIIPNFIVTCKSCFFMVSWGAENEWNIRRRGGFDRSEESPGLTEHGNC